MMKIKEEEETPPISHIRAPPSAAINSRSIGSKSKVGVFVSAVVKVTNIFKGIGSAKLPRKVQKSEMLKKASQSTVDKRCSLPSCNICATSSQRQRRLAEFNERQTAKHRMEADSDDIFD